MGHHLLRLLLIQLLPCEPVLMLLVAPMGKQVLLVLLLLLLSKDLLVMAPLEVGLLLRVHLR